MANTETGMCRECHKSSSSVKSPFSNTAWVKMEGPRLSVLKGKKEPVEAKRRRQFRNGRLEDNENIL
jgi:hypothetical protein